MSISSIKTSFLDFYSSCNKPAFWFCLIELNQILGFTPGVPSVVLYAALIGYAVYVLFKQGVEFSMGLIAFLGYVPLALLVTSPDAIFNSWERFVLFALLVICVAPVVTNEDTIRNRRNMFKMVLVVCLIIGVGSFFARFLGINFMRTYNKDFMTKVGLFGGLTTHSMMLGPIAGIGALYMAYIAYQTRKKWYWLLSALSICSVMFSASRSALAALVAGGTIMLFRLSGSVNKFVITAVIFVMVAAASFPLWGGAMDGVIAKNEANINAGGATNSRENLWNSRLNEFQSSPVFGVGFAAIDRQSSGDGGFDERTGMVESGSSWLIILSMTGLLGALMLVPVLFKAYFTAYRDNDMFSALVCGILTLFFVHMIAEGYIFYGGSQMAFILWLTVGVAMDCKYELLPDSDIEEDNE